MAFKINNTRTYALEKVSDADHRNADREAIVLIRFI